ncbi:MAG: hypothetical protein EZS28_016119 [Streblomastix strix]|uniref:Uncharacterized protein n=1 Tax=Streblomastix strix TaxID=222440 RepID=A0A5J4W1M7_9EUKA|nr:MAG: hypothetical protein EZS28_016119 [Streblomastix strix]
MSCHVSECNSPAIQVALQIPGQAPCAHRFCQNHLRLAVDSLDQGYNGCFLCQALAQLGTSGGTQTLVAQAAASEKSQKQLEHELQTFEEEKESLLQRISELDEKTGTMKKRINSSAFQVQCIQTVIQMQDENEMMQYLAILTAGGCPFKDQLAAFLWFSLDPKKHRSIHKREFLSSFGTAVGALHEELRVDQVV